METEILKKTYERMIKCFMDVVVLSELRKGPMSGHDVVALIHRKFHLLVSSGTVYALLYSLERDELTKGRWEQRRRVYTLTSKGEETLRAILKAKEQILSQMRNIFSK